MAFSLPRLPINWQSQPGLFERFWNEFATKIETVLNQLLDIPEIQQALEDLETATTNAQDAADNANAASTAAASEASLVNSFIQVGSFTPPLISADEFGSVTIASHTRQYGNGDTLAITGTTIGTTAITDEIVRVYYDDATRADTTPTFEYTIDPADPPVQGGDTHSVGAVTIPVSGSVDGKYPQPPGYVEL